MEFFNGFFIDDVPKTERLFYEMSRVETGVRFEGTIFGFDPVSGAPRGQVLDANGAPLVIDGLWGLRAGNGGNGGLANRIYFAAGIDDENHGLFGALAAVPEPETATLEASALGLLLGVALRRRRSALRR